MDALLTKVADLERRVVLLEQRTQRPPPVGCPVAPKPPKPNDDDAVDDDPGHQEALSFALLGHFLSSASS